MTPRLKGLAAFALLVCTGLAAGALAAPPAGTVISNQASASFLDPESGTPGTVTSNAVSISVLPVEGVEVAPDQSALLMPGAQASFPHQVTNTGNVDTTYTATLANLAGDDFDLSALALVLDANGNGLVDAGETAISGPTLAAGEVASVILRGTVPGGATPGQVARVQLVVEGSTPAVADSVTDTVTVIGGAVLSTVKAASDPNPSPGDVVSFTISADNPGLAPAGPVPITLDSAPASFVLLRDVIPPDTTFVDVVGAGAGTPLYHRAGDPASTYVSTAPPAAQVDEVAFGFPSLPGGTRGTAEFRVRVSAAPSSNTITNVAESLYDDGVDPGVTVEPSNPVVLTLATTPVDIAYYTGTTWVTVAFVTALGDPLYVQGDAASCNLDRSSVETTTIQLESLLTSDVETYVAVESGADTGLFRILPDVPTADANAVPAAAGNGAMEVLGGDTVRATLIDCGSGTSVDVDILVDPRGVVFDSQTDLPIAGAVVTLIDVTGAGNGNPGGPATVFATDGVTPAPSTTTTAADGVFEFPLVPPSTYRLDVVAFAGWAFPSALSPAQLPPGRNVVAGGSYGGTFAVPAALGTVVLDVPLDPDGGGGPGGDLFVEKEASLDAAEIGDFVEYSLRIRNNTAALVTGVEVEDVLPTGFRYQGGTARFEGAAIADPIGDPGPRLRFPIGSIDPGETVRLVYRVLVGPGTPEGDAVNEASASSADDPDLDSNVARALVRVVEGVFSERGFVLGKVFVDRNGDGRQEPGEPGIPGVRLWLEDGTFTITDRDGAYSFYGVRPRTHVIKVDATSLPPESRLVPLGHRNAFDADTRFVDLKSGELHRADFAEGSASAAVLDAVATRRARYDQETGELEAMLAQPLRSEETVLYESNVLGRAASGVVDRGRAPSDAFDGSIPSGGLTSRSSNLPPEPVRPSPSVPLESLLSELDPMLDFIDLQDGDTLPAARVTVRVKGPIGASFELAANGVVVPDSRVGQRSAFRKGGVEAWEFVGIHLSPGENTLRLGQRDAFGNERGYREIAVVAPGSLARLRLELPVEPPVADAATPVAIGVRVEDERGTPVTARTPVTLETSAGQWETPDLDEIEPGLQILVSGGRASVLLRPPSTRDDARLRAVSGLLETQRTLPFLPHLRPLVGAGLIEARVAWNGPNADRDGSPRDGDGFEDALEEWAAHFGDRGGEAGVRGALFLKGRVRGDALLTLRYDSEHDPDERLFRDIEPDRFYPVYGDASLRGFDAQSTSRLYVRLDKDRHYALYGDFTTQERDDAIELGGFRRAVTGVRGHAELGPVELDGFASRTDSRQVVVEIPGRGVSGLYEIGDRDIVRNSEQVELIVRDRDQPSLVLEVRPQTRFRDYEIDEIDGTLLFRESIPSRDAELNRVFIRVTYELDQSGSEFWLGGATARVRLGEQVRIGASYARDENPEDELELIGAHAVANLGEDTRLVAEFAQAQRDDAQGNAWRVDLRHAGGRGDLWAYYAETDRDFDNPSSRYARGRTEAGVRGSLRLGERTRLRGDLIFTEDDVTGGQRGGAEVAIERALNDWLSAELGVRHVREGDRPASLDTALADVGDYHFTSARAKLSARVPWHPDLTLFGEYEQDLSDSEARAAALGGEYQLANRTRLYARHEFLSSLTSRFTLNSEQERQTTVIGIQSDYLENTSAFSEYRVRDVIAERDAEAAIGLRNRWELRPGLALHTAFERIHTLEGPDAGDATAASLGVSFTANPDRKATARAEYRHGEAQDTTLVTAGLAQRLDPSWSFLGRGLAELTRRDGDAGDDFLGRLQLGFAYRPSENNRWNALGRYELLGERDHDLGDRRSRLAHIVSLHADLQVTPRLWLTVREAAKWLSEDTGGIENDSFTNLLSGRVTLDVAERFDLGLMAGVLAAENLHSVQYALGVEGGYLLMENLWLSLGYNVAGFEDRDLQGSDYTNRGPYVRLRFKFDEGLLGWLGGDG